MKNPRNRTLTTLITVFLLFSMLLASCREAEPKPAPVTTDASATDPVTTAPEETDPPVTDPQTTTAPPVTDPPTTTAPSETDPKPLPGSYFDAERDHESIDVSKQIIAASSEDPEAGYASMKNLDGRVFASRAELDQGLDYALNKAFYADQHVGDLPNAHDVLKKYDEAWFADHALLFITENAGYSPDATAYFGTPAKLNGLYLQDGTLWCDMEEGEGQLYGPTMVSYLTLVELKRDQVPTKYEEDGYRLAIRFTSYSYLLPAKDL